jgi:hypothetical protein
MLPAAGDSQGEDLVLPWTCDGGAFGVMPSLEVSCFGSPALVESRLVVPREARLVCVAKEVLRAHGARRLELPRMVLW